ncbi:MAG TPA: GTP-binding protein [Anaerolineales bacterium]|nr:GTP-binding protein [Anaerolineae bacterium]HIQ00877.1 GTP-binding protein [Anaerolineales bacterium]
MGRAYKVVVTGSFNAGKSAFISAVSDIPVVSTERRITDTLAKVKETTTVAMDYGQTTVGGCLFHLYGTPGQDRFNFMWDILSREMDGLLVLVDSTDRPSFTVVRRLLRRLRRGRRVPLLVVATKQDGRRALSPEEIAAALRIEPADIVVPCDPRRKSSAKKVLQRLLTYLE